MCPLFIDGFQLPIKATATIEELAYFLPLSPRNVWLVAFAVELFGYLLYYLSFVLTSIENQQYFNFKKQTEAILVRFSKHNFDKCIAPKTIIMFKLVRGLIAQDTNHYILKFFEGIYILYIYIYI